MILKSPVYMIAGLHALYVLPHPFNCARPLMVQHHSRVGDVGYEINFNRHTPPGPLEEIESDIWAIEADIVRMLPEVTASASTGR